ncbi:N-acetylglucosaminyldiphosphoundecaprenol N-acetyl-beta-D-mannosaminyltransferase [Halopseudomonas salegens]|uniref:N-acetylglucosaminyldiphosphoundecaprenol N-acetyl-beta-D-mannosaminyltransferase n=1 Tax=Halopseudomonas salegens TaxID=1434072 RepID=A0A1H2FLZ5_9GAMM|nr:N-acetylglucosaminyldiphosphoundecaprenol N-acetyl-beta-D-mannosaminyltransferase [Halopseudomonas salegens]
MLRLISEKNKSSCQINSNSGENTTFINHYSYGILRKHIELLENFTSIHIDGILLCIVLNRIGIPVRRLSFDMTSLAPAVFERASRTNESIILVGGETGVARIAASNFCQKHPGLNIIAVYSGFFPPERPKEDVLNEIRSAAPDIVICGMGTPRQEEFLDELTKAGWRGTGYTCGGFLHQTAKRGNTYYPTWADKYNLRWLYRIYDEPKLFSRYTIDLIRFLYFFVHDYYRYKKYNQSTIR